MDKQVFDITPDDLLEWPLWYFPMDDTVSDELTVRPVARGAPPPEDYQAIAACLFVDATGREYRGYAYLGSSRVDHAKPLLWVNGVPVTFWNGMADPSGGYLGEVSTLLPQVAWPIRYRSMVATPELSGVLEGLYFIDFDSRSVVCREVRTPT